MLRARSRLVNSALAGERSGVRLAKEGDGNGDFDDRTAFVALLSGDR